MALVFKLNKILSQKSYYKNGEIMMSIKIVVSSLCLILISSIIFSFIGFNSPIFSLNENQILYLFSTSSQVLAGVYGLTLTGFIFFRNELSREEAEDESLAPPVQSLKGRYYKLLLYITILSIITILLSNLVISTESLNKSLLNVILINMGQSFFVVDIVVIAYFIFDVITPKRIEKESKNIQQQVDPTSKETNKGSLEEFLTNYNKLEYILQKYGQAYQSQIEDGFIRNKKRLSNIRLADFIFQAEKIDIELLGKIKDLITLRNTIIHGADPVVSEKMVTISRGVLTDLADALGVII